MNDERKKYVIIFHSKSEQLYTLIKYKTTYEYTVIQPEKARDQKREIELSVEARFLYTGMVPT